MGSLAAARIVCVYCFHVLVNVLWQGEIVEVFCMYFLVSFLESSSWFSFWNIHYWFWYQQCELWLEHGHCLPDGPRLLWWCAFVHPLLPRQSQGRMLRHGSGLAGLLASRVKDKLIIYHSVLYLISSGIKVIIATWRRVIIEVFYHQMFVRLEMNNMEV